MATVLGGCKKYTYVCAVALLWLCAFSVPHVRAEDDCIVSWRTVKVGRKTLACKIASPSSRTLGFLNRRGRFKALGRRALKTSAINGRSMRSYMRVCRTIDPQRIRTRRMDANAQCGLGFGGTPTPVPSSPPAPTVTPTQTPTPTPTLPPRIYLSESSVDFGTVGIGETRYRQILVRPLIGIASFEQIELSAASGISLLTPSQATARGAVACQGTLDRFCVVSLRLDATSIGVKSATLSIRYADVSNPSQLLTSTVPVTGVVQSAATVSSTMFRTVSLRSAAAAQNLSVKDYLEAEYERLAAAPFAAPHDAHLFSAPPVWNNNWANSLFDFSGVAWDRNEAGTAVTRCHVTMATHFQRSGLIRFHRKDSSYFDSSIVQRVNVPNVDITIGKLSPCLPEDWTVYPLLSSEEGAPFSSSELFQAPYITTHFKFSDAIRRISLYGFGNFGQLASYTLPSYLPLSQCGPDLMCAYPQAGDSGNPNFLIINGELVLVSQWWTTGGGPNFGFASVQNAVRSAILSMP